MRKILISPGYGAGWSSWGDPEQAKFVVTYQPIIDFLESGGQFEEADISSFSAGGYENFKEPGQSILKQFIEDLGEDFYLGGARGLIVEYADDDELVRIHEYDGYESLERFETMNWL